MNRTLLCAAALVICGVPVAATPARTHHRSHSHRAYAAPELIVDNSPVVVEPFQTAGQDAQTAHFIQRMRLENGLLARGTRYLNPANVTDRDSFVLYLLQSLEGGFDSVNMYDRGVISWGLMQWASHVDCFDDLLRFMKMRLTLTGRSQVWARLFVAQGIDVDPRGLILFGKPAESVEEKRIALRGTRKPGEMDVKLASHWITVLAHAGRQPVIAQLQEEYAGQSIDRLFDRPIAEPLCEAPAGRPLTISELAARNPYDLGLVFALWTNSPTHAVAVVHEAARKARIWSGTAHIVEWKPGLFHAALAEACRAANYGNWGERLAFVSKRMDAARAGTASTVTPYEVAYERAVFGDRAPFQIASRHAATSFRMLVVKRAVPASVKRLTAAAVVRPVKTIAVPALHPAAPLAGGVEMLSPLIPGLQPAAVGPRRRS